MLVLIDNREHVKLRNPWSCITAAKNARSVIVRHYVKEVAAITLFALFSTVSIMLPSPRKG